MEAASKANDWAGVGRWVRDRATGEVGRVVEVDHARGFGGCVRLAAPADTDWRGVAGPRAGLTPWVPGVGERVDGACFGRGYVTADPPVTPGVDACVLGASGFGSRVAVSALTPVLDASGRPVVVRGVHYPGDEVLRMLAAGLPTRGEVLRANGADAHSALADAEDEARSILGPVAIMDSIRVERWAGGYEVSYAAGDGKNYGLRGGTVRRVCGALLAAAESRANHALHVVANPPEPGSLMERLRAAGGEWRPVVPSWSAAMVGTPKPAKYAPRVGDLVAWGHDDGMHLVVSEHTAAGPRCTAVGESSSVLLDGATLVPLRPDAIGQRVRLKRGLDLEGSVTACELAGRLCRVLWDGDSLDEGVSTAELVRVVAPAYDAPGPVAKIPAAAEVIRGVSPCQHCGAEIALGLLRDTCPKGCDLTLRAAEPEPSTLLERWAVREPTGVGTRRIVDDPRPNSEPFWWAEGKGVQVNHPTRDGAIAAWRAAVKGGAR